MKEMLRGIFIVVLSEISLMLAGPERDEVVVVVVVDQDKAVIAGKLLLLPPNVL